MSGVNANTHLVNGIVSLVDVFVFGVPISLFHMIYPVSFGVVYGGFTGIYYGANGTNPFIGERYIYPVLNYADQPTGASITLILVAFLFVPIVHLVYYALYLARFWLVYVIYGRSGVPCWGEVSEEQENKKPLEAELPALV